MRMTRLLIGALAACASLAFAQSPNPPGLAQGLDKPRHVDAARCTGSVCRLAVRVASGCAITVDPEWLFVSGKNVQLVWELQDPGYSFHPTQGVAFKDEYNPQWRNEFYRNTEGEIFIIDGTILGNVNGGAARSSWRYGDLNTQPGVFRYNVVVVNNRTNEECRADPGVINDW